MSTFLNNKNIIKSYDPKNTGFSVSEDREERLKRREERRQKRKEEGFGADSKDEYEETSGSGKFNLKDFEKSVDIITNQILAVLSDIETQKKRNLGTSKEAEKFKEKFKKNLVRSTRLLGEIRYRIEKEGKRLEPNDEKDRELIKTYREAYKSIKNDIASDSEDYNTAITKAVSSALEDDKYSDISKKIQEAIKILSEASTDFDNVPIWQANPGSIIVQQGSDINSGTEGGNQGSSSSTIKIKDTIKAGSKITEEEGKIVVEVKKLIQEVFKGTNIEKNSNWKIVFKNITSSFRGNTQALIKAIKKELPELKDDKTSDITQAFVEALEKKKTKTEKKNEGIEFNSSNILSFESFLKNRG
jgi:hypothetical protein